MQLSSSLALLVSLVAVGATYGRYARDVYARDLYARHYDYDSLYAREADASGLYARGYDPLYARDVYERNAYDDDELYARDTWEGLETRDADADASLLNLIPLPIQKGTCQRGSLYARTYPVPQRLGDLCVWRCANAVWYSVVKMY
jgi:hypothetical protein